MKYNPYTKELKTQVFDIETMGLYPVHDIVINAGFCNCDQTDLYQTFLEDPMLESQMLKEILDRISELDAVVTYNGNRFDLPFIVTRAKKYGITDHLPILWSIDVYHWLRKYWPLAKTMEHLNQKSVEYALGLSDHRDDKIGGGECIELYARYINIRETSAKEKILLHNGDDVRQLAKITEKLSFLPYHQIAYEEGFLIKTEFYKVLIKGTRYTNKHFSIKGKTVKGLMPVVLYEDGFQFEYDALQGEIELNLYPEEKDGKLFMDLTTLPVPQEIFDETYSGFLLLKDENGIHYKNVNQLTKEITKKALG